MVKAMRVSAHANYHGLKANAFVGLSTVLQEKYKALMEEAGYPLGHILYQKRQITRYQKKIGFTGRKGFLDVDDIETNHTIQDFTLASSYYCRVSFNLEMWNRMVKTLPIWKFEGAPDFKTIVYVGFSGITQLENLIAVKDSELDVLCSFVYMSENVYETLLTVKKEQNGID
jgi:hypothetical protein